MTGTSMASPYVAGVAAHDARARAPSDVDTNRRNHAANGTPAAWFRLHLAGRRRLRPPPARGVSRRSPQALSARRPGRTSDEAHGLSRRRWRLPAARHRATTRGAGSSSMGAGRPPTKTNTRAVLGQLRADEEQSSTSSASRISTTTTSPGFSGSSRTRSSGARSSSRQTTRSADIPEPRWPGPPRSARSGTTGSSGSSATTSVTSPETVLATIATVLAGSPRRTAARSRVRPRRPRDRRAGVDGIVAASLARAARHLPQPAHRRPFDEARRDRSAAWPRKS